MTDKTTSCPECGSDNSWRVNGQKNQRVCSKCGQDWWTDIDYDNAPKEKVRALAGCQNQGCAEEVSYPLYDLAFWRGKPICQSCYEYEGEGTKDWNELPPVELRHLKCRGIDMRTDLDALQDGDRIILFPNEQNPIHKSPVFATYQSGYFYCDEAYHEHGPDYYFGDVLTYNDGFEVVSDG